MILPWVLEKDLLSQHHDETMMSSGHSLAIEDNLSHCITALHVNFDEVE